MKMINASLPHNFPSWHFKFSGTGMSSKNYANVQNIWKTECAGQLEKGTASSQMHHRALDGLE